MTTVIFYEKPGCAGNARQRKLLVESGHVVDIRNLLAQSWTAETLRPFFGDRPVCEWFNKSAPAVKSGEIDPAALDETQALALMIENPLLIRRPLLQVGEQRQSGFDTAMIDAWIGLETMPGENLDGCVHGPDHGCTRTKA